MSAAPCKWQLPHPAQLELRIEGSIHCSLWSVLQGGWASGGGAGPIASSPGALGDGLMSPRGTAGFVDGLLGMGKAGTGEA